MIAPVPGASHGSQPHGRRPQRDALFSWRAPRSPARTGARLGVALGALLINAGASDWRVSASLAVAAWLWAALQGRAWRALRLMAWTLPALGAGAWAHHAGALPGLDGVLWREPLCRMLAGSSWAVSLGAGLDWPSLRALLRALGAPARAIQGLDEGLWRGLALERAWRARVDAVRLRLGRAWPPWRALGQLLGQGALGALERAERAQESLMMRQAPRGDRPLGESLGQSQGRAQGRAHDRAQSPPEAMALEFVECGAHAVEAVSLRVEPGQWVALGGPSGAGKSTVLRLAAGLCSPQRGLLRRGSRTLTAKTPLPARLDADVALLWQSPELQLLASTPLEDVAFGLGCRGLAWPQAEQEALVALRALGVEALAHRPCDVLSVGEQRRVALAGALSSSPGLLLLDEPTSGLDPVARAQLIAAVEAACDARPMTVLWATHDLDALPTRCTRLVLMRQGQLCFDGDVASGRSPAVLASAGLLPHDDPRISEHKKT